MVGYINTVRDREYKLCTPEQFDDLVGSPMVATHIEDYRKGNEASKSLLAAFLFQGYDPNVLLGKKGSRLAKALKPTGFFIMDFDHVEDVPKLYDKFLRNLPNCDLKMDDLALAHITPSGKGLRLVIRLKNGERIEDAQGQLALRLGENVDSVVKDLSRLSFCPMKQEILYINKQLLFSTPRQDDYTSTTTTAAAPASDERPTAHDAGATAADFNEYYRGIPLRRIVEQLTELHGGAPEVGGRELMVFRLASDLAKLTDRSAPWLETLIPTFGLPEAEWRTTIAQVCKKPLEAGYSRLLQQAIQRCRAEQAAETANAGAAIPLAEYKDTFPVKVPALVRLLTSRCLPHMKEALSQMLFPALAAHVGNHKFLMGDDTEQELGLMAVLVGKQSAGKSCINKPIQIICADMRAVDAVNMQRLKTYNERRKNRKASERGESRPDDIIIRCLGGNVTNASLLQLLTAAESGDPNKPNQCLYSEVREIQRLYKMGTDGTRLGVADLIKAAFDRDLLDSFRATIDAVTTVASARWNFSAATTPDGAADFFKDTLLTDGTLSRIAFCSLPNVDIPVGDYTVGKYDDEWVEQLKPYIERLGNYRHPVDDTGRAVPLLVPEAEALRCKLNELIEFERKTSPDPDTYQAYAFRTRDIVVRQALTTWIANGCQWEQCDDYWLWVYGRQMDTKLSMFGERAAEKFEAETPKARGQWTPLREMKRVFTYAEFADVCAKSKVKMRNSPRQLLSSYKYKGLLTQDGDSFTLTDEVCKRYGIR